MGGRSSKPAPAPTPAKSYGNEYIYYEGCMALTGDDYDAGQMTAAPFLVVPIIDESLSKVVTWTKMCVKALGENRFKEFEMALNAHMRAFAGSQEGIELPPGMSLGGTEGQNITWQSSMNDALQQKLQDAVLEAYDPKKDFEQRLRDLLRILNLVNYEALYLKAFQYKPPKKPSEADDLIMSSMPDSLKIKTFNVMGSDGINMDRKIATPQLPGLPPARKSPSLADRPYKFVGPAYLLVANNLDGPKYVESYLYFPSMTKDAIPAPNYDFIGRSHRWLFRFINDASYTTTGSRCQFQCFGTEPPPPPPPKQTKRVGRFGRIERFRGRRPPPPPPPERVMCGCRSGDNEEVCGKLEEREIKNKEGKVISKEPPFEISFIAYRLNLNHPFNQQYFAPDSPHKVQLNILPTEWDIYPGCKYSIISSNHKFYTRIESFDIPIPGTFQRGRKRAGRKRRPGTQLFTPAGKYGIYYNHNEDLVQLCKDKKKPTRMQPIFTVEKNGYPSRLVLEDGVLNLFFSADLVENDNEVSVWSMEVAEPEAAEPLALVLLDNGRMDVFDRNNKSVMSEKFRMFQEAQWARFGTGEPELMSLEMQGSSVSTNEVLYKDAGADGEYDPRLEYARRLLHLKDWLRARNLLFEKVSQYVDLSSMTAKRLMKGDTSTFLTYNAEEDYRSRYGELVRFLRSNGYPL
jgi:hypothetical protein